MQKERLNKAQSILTSENIDAVLIAKPENRRYISNFTGSVGFLVITKEAPYILVDFRYIEQAKSQCEDFKVVEINKENPIENIFQKLNLKRVGFEDEYMTYQQYNKLYNKKYNIDLVPLGNKVNKLRMAKSQTEVDYIKKAASLADEAFDHILSFIQPNMVEREISLELEFFMKKKGASANSFDFIVASGKRSSLPHGVASNKKITKGDFVTFDFGCVYHGYCSDMTRTIVIGEANTKQLEIYNTVLKAQETALRAVKPGITGKELDEIARNIIAKKGFGQYFGHGLGHGVGLEVHELPHISVLGEEPLKPGMVITIEPGIYIPDFGGVRIEDLVVVTDDGYEVLSKSTKELIELNI
ncbi:Xaa-Pro peptidase family protein [Serpentinicella sp. ANB-PHB4]|uniref:M24 family metallopeptidase n=1 Tax=Serpentinicella sp. ANB-PHB4 TaxID=3074076 RepID=UPI00285DBAC3|nr:Xaa-Pro peptidase family protein [Serpentinicella sp. ANB-PHB4]MDR5658203.1 Xaa-Pro peptidase family protein [Serpentinicella sp. ANB-PHB4]